MEMENYCSDILSKDFLKNYVNKKVPWKNGLAFAVYKRTYARTLDNGLQEEYWQTLARVINGAQKIGAKYTKSEAEKLYDYMFNFKCLYAGRMLWQLGTPLVDRFSGNSLINCFYTNISCIDDFCFLFENLMLGGGVGFSVRREHVHELPKVKTGVKIKHENTKDADFIVPDKREGWTMLLKKVLKSYLETGESFSYSTILVRGHGEEIKTFGGTASGPGILIDGIEKICEICASREGKKIRSIDALDICNIIGGIVVSGNVRRCLPENSFVHTDLGLKFIQDIKIGDKVLTTDGYKLILNTFNQGKQELLKINTQDGYFECTAKHKMAIFIDDKTYIWKNADELKSGDRLISTRTPLNGKKTKLPKWNYTKPLHSTTCQDIVIPNLDEKMAWFLGLFQADGYCYAKPRIKGVGPDANQYVSLVFQSNELEIAKEAKKQLERFGLKNVKLKKRKDEDSLIVICSSKQIATYFHDWLKQPKKQIKIPDCILNARQSIKISYLRGLMDGDGCVKNRPVNLLITCYEKFAKDIQSLCYSCGFETRLSKNSDNCKSRAETWKRLYFVNLITQHSKEILSNGFGIKEIGEYSKSHKANSFPLSWFKNLNNKQKSGCAFWSNSNINIDKYNEIFGFSDLCPVKIKSIEKSSIKNTYDIEVDEKHEFFCNGYLTHNSAQIALGDADDYLFLKAKRWDAGNIPNWRAMSNNTVTADSYEYVSNLFWEGYNGNTGEPYGLFNLNLNQTHGRLGEKAQDTDIQGLNPCGEIGLENGGVCNLSEVFLGNVNSKEELFDCVRLLYKTQKAICSLNYLHDRTTKIVHKNRRIGIGVGGICQSFDKIEWLDKCYKKLRKFDKEWSKENNWPESIKLTTIKPSGTISLLANSSPGVHPAYSQYYIRRVRMGSSDNMVQVCRDHGYKTEFQINFDESIDRGTIIVEFPCFIGENVKIARDMTAVDQLELVKKIQTVWADNAVSCTVYYKKEELKSIKDWLEKNYDKSVKSVSFLLHKEEDHGFKQPPYEEITKEEYEEMIKSIKPFEDIEINDLGTLDGLECAGGACPIR